MQASFERPRPAATAASLGFLLIGWSSLLIPSLIREVQRDFDQTDAGLGVFFLIHAATYVAGSIGGGALTERIARRPVLVGGAVLMVIGLIGLGTVPTWPLFLLATVPLGLGTGTLDGGGNGLVLDLFSTARGRALNLLHLFFSVGGLSSPVTVGLLVEAGLPWQIVLLGTGLAAAAVAFVFGLVAMPSGRRAPRGTVAPVRLVRDPILLALGVAIACYVGAEVGVSNWLVRFLESAPLAVATGALSLFWVGLTLGRIAAARFADRFDHVRLAIVASIVAATALVAAIVAPSVEVAIASFTLAGFAFGPVFPLIMAIGGDRFPGRSAAVSGLLAGVAVAGSVAYPPIMGFVSVAIGLSAAMLGTAVLTVASAAALVVAGRRAQAWAVSG